MSGRTILVNQIWEHWATKNRIRVAQVADEIRVIHATTHEGTFHRTEFITPDHLLHQFVYVGEVEP